MRKCYWVKTLNENKNESCSHNNFSNHLKHWTFPGFIFNPIQSSFGIENISSLSPQPPLLAHNVLDKTAKILLNLLHSIGTQNCNHQKEFNWKIIDNSRSLLKCIWMPRILAGSLCPKCPFISLPSMGRGWRRGKAKEFLFSKVISRMWVI